MKEKIRIGQIGIGHNHGEAKMLGFRKFPELFEIVGVNEDDPSWLEKRGHLKGYEGLPFLSREEILEKSDAILVETDVPYLTRTAQICVDAGKHIHLDKPASGAGESLEDYRRVLETARAKDLIVQLGYMYRYNPAIMWCMEKVRNGELGEIYSVTAEMNTFHGKPYKQWLSQFDGGIMYILGSHLVDLVVSLLGAPQKINSFFRHTGLDGVDFPDNNLAVLEYEKALARIFVSSVEVNGWGRRQFTVAGSRGTIAIMPIEHKLTVSYAHVDMGGKTYADKHEDVPFDDIPSGGRYDLMAQDFYAYVKGEKENPYSYDHEYLVQKVLCDVIGGGSGKI